MITYLKDHPYDLQIAIILAIVFAIIVAIIIGPSRKLIETFLNFIFPAAFPRFRNLFKKYFKKDWIVLSNYYAIDTEKTAEGVFNNSEFLQGTYTKGYHYSDIGNYYHLWRWINVLSFLNSPNLALDEMMQHVLEKIKPVGINLVLCTPKGSNLFIVGILGNTVFQGRKEKTLFHNVLYNEFEENDIIKRVVKYEDGDSLSGKKIILIETLLIFPEPLKEIIREIKRQGGIIKKVIILFNGCLTMPSLSTLGICDDDILVAWNINLKISTYGRCSSCKPPIEKLLYQNY
jgi:hypothetical protein